MLQQLQDRGMYVNCLSVAGASCALSGALESSWSWRGGLGFRDMTGLSRCDRQQLEGNVSCIDQSVDDAKPLGAGIGYAKPISCCLSVSQALRVTLPARGGRFVGFAIFGVLRRLSTRLY